MLVNGQEYEVNDHTYGSSGTINSFFKSIPAHVVGDIMMISVEK